MKHVLKGCVLQSELQHNKKVVNNIKIHLAQQH